MKAIKHIMIVALLMPALRMLGQDTLMSPSLKVELSGHLSAWGHYNPLNTMQLSTGARYILQGNGEVNFRKDKKIDIEASGNFLGTSDMRTFDSISFVSDLNPYRLWVRYSGRQTELRVGLQKINFGSAQLIRPLMWFDQLDPRDPQQLSNGLWGALGRYYFINNANIWLWGLYGNEQQRPWDIGATSNKIPEIGGRLQLPVKHGEVAFTYHHRNADMTTLGVPALTESKVPENRFGFDARLDVVVGLWTEMVWVNKQEDMGTLTNQQFLNLGTDYTLPVGNGLYVVYEHLLYSSDKDPFQFKNTINFSALSLNYPLSLDDQINTIVFYDWKNNASYNFLSWKHVFGRIQSNLMLYYNPKKYNLPQQGSASAQFAGKGIQIMFIYNH